MLVLSRKVGETIRIDNNIIVTIVEIRGDKIRIGVTAPQNIAIHRQEVAYAIARNKKAAKKESIPEVSDPPADS